MKGRFAQRRPQGARAQVLNEKNLQGPGEDFPGLFFGVFLKNGQKNSNFFDFFIRKCTGSVFLGFVKDKG